MYALTQLFCGDTCHAYYLMTKVSKYEAKRFRIKYEKTDTIRYFQSTLSSFADYSVITNNICSKKKRQIFYKYSKYLNQYNSFILRDSTHKEIILERGREIYFNENYILYLGGDCSVDIHPYFPGGDDSLKKYIENKLRYPQYAKTHHYQGTVYVEFTVDNNGKVKDVILSMGKEEHLDNEALRVISLLPDWTPGIVNNKYVSVLYIIPIRFEL
jgi:TonB family protein